MPGRDFHDMTSLLGARLILTMIGALAHAGRLGMTDDSPAVVQPRPAAGARAGDNGGSPGMSDLVRPQTVPVPLGRPSFLDTPRCESLDTLDADVAIIAFPYTVPYTIEWSRQPSSWAPGSIREASMRYPTSSDITTGTSAVKSSPADGSASPIAAMSSKSPGSTSRTVERPPP